MLKTGRRRQVRRQTDKRNIHMLDYYPPNLFYVLVAVLCLSVMDAFLTLWLIENGAMEINPVMAYYLELGPDVFLATKYMITAMVVTIGVATNYAMLRFFHFEFGQLLKVFAGCFSLVVAWELFLVARLVI